MAFEGRYLVSNQGHVASLMCSRGRRKHPRIMKPKVDKDGYLRITLTGDNGLSRYIGVHAIVCEAWHGSCPDGMIARHLDGSKASNIPANLAWGTHQQNKHDSMAHGTWVHGERFGRVKLREGDVLQIRTRIGETQQAMADEFGVTQTCIQKIVSGKSWKYLL